MHAKDLRAIDKDRNSIIKIASSEFRKKCSGYQSSQYLTGHFGDKSTIPGATIANLCTMQSRKINLHLQKYPYLLCSTEIDRYWEVKSTLKSVYPLFYGIDCS